MEAQTKIVFLMFIAALAVQSTYSASSGNVDAVCSRRIDMLVGDTESTSTNVPFTWGPEYEVAVRYLTSRWSDTIIANKTAQMAVFKSAFLQYCVNSKNILNNFLVQVNANPKETQEFKDDIYSWYNYATGKYVSHEDSLPKNADLAFYQVKFDDSYYHFIRRARLTVQRTELSETKQNIDDMSKEMMDMLLETLKNLTEQFYELAKTNALLPVDQV